MRLLRFRDCSFPCIVSLPSYCFSLSLLASFLFLPYRLRYPLASLGHINVRSQVALCPLEHLCSVNVQLRAAQALGSASCARVHDRLFCLLRVASSLATAAFSKRHCISATALSNRSSLTPDLTRVVASLVLHRPLSRQGTCSSGRRRRLRSTSPISRFRRDQPKPYVGDFDDT